MSYTAVQLLLAGGLRQFIYPRLVKTILKCVKILSE